MVSIYVRPYEWNPDLAAYPFLQVFCVLALVGLAIDIAMRRTILLSNPLLPYCAFFVFWCVVTLAYEDASLLGSKISPLMIALLLYVLISHSVQTVKAFTRLMVTIFSVGLFVAYVGADQGLNHFGCHVQPPDKNDPRRPIYDGRECEAEGELKQEDAVMLCYVDGKNVYYRCEKPGLFGTSSIEGRVRYLGVLTDPNEVALATSLALPLAFALFEMKRSTMRLALLLFGVGLIALEVVFTKSRGGQIVFAVALGAYFVRKYGIRRGLMVAGTMAVPLVALGGRSGDSADQSAIERLEAAACAIKLLMQHPIRGAGFGQFLEHNPLTAHNAYLLSAGELGWPGLLAFSSIIFLSIKTTVSVLRFEFADDDAEQATIQALAMAMLAAFSGITIGIFFLSWTYHFILWIHFGLVGSLYAVMRKKYPQFSVRLTRKELGFIFLGWVLLLTALTIHIKRKGCW